MKKMYQSPDFEKIKIQLSNQIMNPSVTDEGLVPGGPGENPIEE
jgi:hypothetical protein